jgi:hypothetical protein
MAEGNDREEATGRARGGIARAKSLTPEQRKEQSRRAALARWSESVPVATHIGELKIGDLVLSCAVLPDGTRVISQGAVATAFGPVPGGWQNRKRAQDGHSGALPTFLVAASLQGFISDDLRTKVSSPRNYRDPRGGPIRVGFEATLLPMVCEVWLKARDADALTKIQKPVAERAELLMRGLAHTGIIALVDEATGFQADRAKDALAKILEAFIEKELQPWVKTFPTGYYEELFRLRGLQYPRDSVKRPQYFGVLTNDIVYKRLAPGVLEELKRVTVKNEAGRPRHRYFQHLTQNLGYPKLREHLGAVVAVMQLSADYRDFIDKLDRIRPRYGENMLLPFGQGQDQDNGTGL